MFQSQCNIKFFQMHFLWMSLHESENVDLEKQRNWWTEAVEKEKHTNRDADDDVLKWLFAQHKNYVQSLTSKPTY